jgi:hypothetical protein
VPEEIKAGDKPLKVEGHHSDPFVIDWDGDGDLHVLSGSSAGGVQWAENRAPPGKAPQLEPFQTLIKATPRVEYGQVLREADLKGPLSDTRIWIDDFNSDGKLDVFVGDLVNLISPADGLTESQMKVKSDAWMKSLQEASQKQHAADSDDQKQQEAQKQVQELFSQRSKFVKEDRTGFVWLYLQK